MQKKSLLVVLLSLMLLFAQAQKNLVTNGGFEDDDLYGWNQNDGAKQTPWAFKNGKNACAIITATTDKWVGIDQIVKIPKKVLAVEFSVWITTTNVVKGKNDWDGAVFTVVFLNSADKEIGEGVNIARVTGDNDWIFFKKVIKIPGKAFSVKILIALGNASGTMIVDNVTAKVANPEDVSMGD